MKNTYYAHIDGFSSNHLTMPEVQQWWDGLKAKYTFSGKTLMIWTVDANSLVSAKPIFMQAVR